MKFTFQCPKIQFCWHAAMPTHLLWSMADFVPCGNRDVWSSKLQACTALSFPEEAGQLLKEPIKGEDFHTKVSNSTRNTKPCVLGPPICPGPQNTSLPRPSVLRCGDTCPGHFSIADVGRGTDQNPHLSYNVTQADPSLHAGCLVVGLSPTHLINDTALSQCL